MFIGLLCNHVVYLQKKKKEIYSNRSNYIVTTIAACATVWNEGPASPMEWYLWSFSVSVIIVPPTGTLHQSSKSQV